MAASDSPYNSTTKVTNYLGADISTDGNSVNLTSSNTSLGVQTSNVDLSNYFFSLQTNHDRSMIARVNHTVGPVARITARNDHPTICGACKAQRNFRSRSAY